jgi:hypothetical protein
MKNGFLVRLFALRLNLAKLVIMLIYTFTNPFINAPRFGYIFWVPSSFYLLCYVTPSLLLNGADTSLHLGSETIFAIPHVFKYGYLIKIAYFYSKPVH